MRRDTLCESPTALCFRLLCLCIGGPRSVRRLRWASSPLRELVLPPSGRLGEEAAMTAAADLRSAVRHREEQMPLVNDHACEAQCEGRRVGRQLQRQNSLPGSR